MTKEALLVELAGLRDKVAVQAHLASAVDAKDKEIIELKKLEVELKGLRHKVQEQQHLAS